MKPLPRAPLTPEDEAIRNRWRIDHLGHRLLFLADTGAEIQGDRRDADLMFFCQQVRGSMVIEHPRYRGEWRAALWYFHNRRGPPIALDLVSNITYFA